MNDKSDSTHRTRKSRAKAKLLLAAAFVAILATTVLIHHHTRVHIVRPAEVNLYHLSSYNLRHNYPSHYILTQNGVLHIRFAPLNPETGSVQIRKWILNETSVNGPFETDTASRSNSWQPIAKRGEATHD